MKTQMAIEHGRRAVPAPPLRNFAPFIRTPTPAPAADQEPAHQESHRPTLRAPGLDQEFSQIPSLSAGSVAASQQAMQSCPLSLNTPRTCPFGGACHTCPVRMPTKLASNQPANQAEGLPQPNDARSVTARDRAHDFNRVPAHPDGATEQSAADVTATPTRSVDGGAMEEEVVTTNGAPPAPGVTSLAPPLPAGSTGQCHVDSGPTYTPGGTIPVTNTGGRKRATFSMAATFGTALVTVPPRKPSCCQVRQYIKWDSAFHTWRGGPPHSGFPSSASAGTWYEDRDTADKRYGHRSGTHSDPGAGCGDEYRTGTTQDQANGNTYCGRDAPGGPSAMTGQYQFQLKVIDTCNANAEKASSSIITINW